ncbi:zinc-dependent alcohol dehydrogenase [Clostridium beijerinckii]|uniref:zinc-dependent alcohol dehydrogenase n=1 Tax=Clostridium beijerinckii TaxID=1520 RepID=UPI0006854C1B|nr:alcohol dehydrogenase catalytic domain-containing protein [Clostridium beijerinckii]
MKAVICHDVECIEVRDIPEPFLPGSEWVKIKVKAVGLCGSDIQKILYSWPPEGYIETQILGHEIAGEVVEKGIDSKKFKIGDRVAVEPLVPCYQCDACKKGKYQLCSNLISIGRNLQGGFADYVCVPENQLYKLPSEVSFIEGSMADLVAVAVHCVQMLDMRKDNCNVAIIGDGPLALICCQVVKVFGAKQVTLVGKHDFRLKLAKDIGVDRTIYWNQVDNQLNNFDSSFNVVIEAVGGKQSVTLHKSIKIAAPGGTIAVLGVFDFDYEGKLPLREAFYKELNIVGCNSYSTWDYKKEFEIALSLMGKGLININPIITHRLPLTDFCTGLNYVKRKVEENLIKIVFQPL